MMIYFSIAFQFLHEGSPSIRTGDVGIYRSRKRMLGNSFRCVLCNVEGILKEGGGKADLPTYSCADPKDYFFLF